MASKYLSDDPDLHLYDEIVDEATDLSGSLRIGLVATAQDIFDKFIINLGLRESVKWSEVRPLTQRLIDQGVHTFHLNRITDLFPNEPVIALEMLQMISSQATTISELTIRGKMCTRYRNMHLEIKTEICKMKSLKKLEIEKFHFYVQDLIEFCPQLPALQLIKVKIAPTIPVFEDRDQAKEFRCYELQIPSRADTILYSADATPEIRRRTDIIC
ncbi:Hypothetical predicted protein [Cloeon dipterum]|uniref:Uncharacterized protein n=1 Tax=Cloeon dipterum TaxID=197152 RepID=A0A8S1DH60_9INSE|nr:Hypothetical predicted protein [Cloeon dipterum]